MRTPTRIIKKVGIWFAIVLAHTMASRIAQEVWAANGHDAVEAMGVRGYINGAGTVLSTIYVLLAVRSIEDNGE